MCHGGEHLGVGNLNLDILQMRNCGAHISSETKPFSGGVLVSLGGLLEQIGKRTLLPYR